MFEIRIVKAAAAGVLALLSLGGTVALTGCSTPSNVVATANDAERLDEQRQLDAKKEVSGIITKVGDEAVTEQQVSDYITQYRTYANLTNDADWATFMDQSGLSAEKLREEAAYMFARRIAVEAKAKELGIEVSDVELDEAVEEARAIYGQDKDDKSWESFLSSVAYDDEAEYRADLKYSLTLERVVMKEGGIKAPGNDMLASTANDNIEAYTGKLIWTAVYPSDAMDAAKQAVKQVGKKAVKASKFTDIVGNDVDNGIAEKVVGPEWTCLVSVSGTAQAVIDNLQVGHAAMYTADDGKISIVYVEEQYTTKRNGKIDLSTMPKKIRAKLESDTSHEMRTQALSDYESNLVEDGSLQINHKPSGLPYDVDMALSTYQKNETEEVDTEAQAANQVAELERLGKEQQEKEAKAKNENSSSNANGNKSE